MRLKIRYVYKRFLFGLVSCLITFTMVINSVFFAFADTSSIAQMDPALIPIFTTVASVAVALGIQAQNGADALNALVNSAIDSIKTQEIERSEADSTYNSPYTVFNGGRKEKPNNNNKNGKWFAIAGASALTGAVLGEKGMIEDIATTLKNKGAFQSMQGSAGVFSADEFKTKGTASSVALDLANISSSALRQFNDFLASDFWDNNNIDKNNCLFFVNTYIPDILQANPVYPNTYVTVIEKSDDLKYVDLVGNAIGYYNFSNNYGSMSYYYPTRGTNVMTFLNEDHIALKLRTAKITISSRDANTNFSYGVSTSLRLNSSIGIFGNTSSPSDINRWALSGYKWQYATPWGFTQNVYNSNETIVNQYPNWSNEQISLLGEQIDALRIGIQNLNNPWSPTQTEIQTSPAPDAVISQLLNNWLNPENAPDPDPDPDPEPDPDPSPYPDPVPEPVPDDHYLGEFMLPSSITEKFPFSIPFDIARCLRLFNTNSREAPRWECDLHYGNNTSHIVLDLSVFNDVAALIRPIEFIAFLVGLAYATRYLIKG